MSMVSFESSGWDEVSARVLMTWLHSLFEVWIDYGFVSWLRIGTSDDAWRSWSFFTLEVELNSWRVDAGTEAAVTDAVEATEALTADNLLSIEPTLFSLEIAGEESSDWDDDKWRDDKEMNKKARNKQNKE